MLLTDGLIDGVRHYSRSQVAAMVGRTGQAIHLYDRWSDELEARGKPRLIPKPKIVPYPTGTIRLWSKADVQQIADFDRSARRGSLKERLAVIKP